MGLKALHIPNVLVTGVWLSLVVLLLCSAASCVATAQDSHYWTNQYGTMANMLGGAVVGSVRDPSSVYYNPGAMGLSQDSTLIISAEVLQVRELRYHGWEMWEEDLVSLAGGTAPSMFAVRVPFRLADDHQLAISYLKRQDLNVEFQGIVVDQIDALPPPGDETLSAEALMRQNMGEYWYGLTWNYKASDRMAVGGTWTVAIRSQRNRIQAIAQLLADDGSHNLANVITDYSFSNVRMLWKLGAALDRGPWALGLTVTTPSLDLFGRGSAHYNIGLFDSETAEGNSLIADTKKDVDADYESPLSVAAGASYRFRSTRLHVTGEWFNEVKEFEVISLEGFVIDVGDATVYPSLVHGLNEVFNVGIGIDHRFHSGISIYGGFTTDYSAFKSDYESMLSVTNWDIYHATLGSSFSFYHIGVTLGLTYSFGNGLFDRMAGFSEINSSGDLIATSEENAISYRQLRFIIGIDY